MIEVLLLVIILILLGFGPAVVVGAEIFVGIVAALCIVWMVVRAYANGRMAEYEYDKRCGRKPGESPY
jgi:hypothetical protein